MSRCLKSLFQVTKLFTELKIHLKAVLKKITAMHLKIVTVCWSHPSTCLPISRLKMSTQKPEWKEGIQVRMKNKEANDYQIEIFIALVVL